MSKLEALRDAILALDGPVFAVLDGAQFENLPDTLLRSGLENRCLYLDRGDNHPERLITAPYMVRLGTGRPDLAEGTSDDFQSDLARLLRFLVTPRAAVFWRCPEGGDHLYKHLRGLNRVLVPLTDGPTEARRTDETHEAVIFRHADANVLMQVIPALGTSQLARLLGPATLIMFTPEGEPQGAESDACVKGIRRREDWPRPSPGMLRIETHQYDAMRTARLERSRRRLMVYLRDCAPDETQDLRDEDLMQEVLVAEQSGRRLGLRSEAAHGQWAFLMMTTGGQIQNGEVVRRAVGQARDPDKAVSELMREMVRMSQASQTPTIGRRS